MYNTNIFHCLRINSLIFINSGHFFYYLNIKFNPFLTDFPSSQVL